MKKVFALMLAVLCMVLAACGEQPSVATPDTPSAPATYDEPEVTTTAPTEPTTTLANDRFDPVTYGDVIGSWSTVITLDGSIFKLTDMEEKVEMTLVYQLNGDGTYYRGVRPDEYQTAIATFGAAVEQHVIDGLYATFVGQKIYEEVSKKKIPALWEETEKADAEEQAKRFVEGLYLDYRFSRLNGEGDYYVEDGLIWFSTAEGTYEPCSYTLSEEGLTITEVDNPKLYKQMNLDIPMLLTKA